ncbi:MAG: Txe/YoeB family addiction module toxin [Bacteroidales bacterium]|nr:Txe/YoeB family addiction module toxin [Candidatus Cloacimonadota bacterium]MBS3772224.1 Txe/YoeB family addiction module toxin [Bacteroidales bacterium]
MKNITFTPQAYKDYLNWLNEDKKIFLKITTLIKEIAKNPEKGTGKPERLKHELKGYWSRRITREHRLVYRITDENIEIISCKYHYTK